MQRSFLFLALTKTYPIGHACYVDVEKHEYSCAALVCTIVSSIINQEKSIALQHFVPPQGQTSPLPQATYSASCSLLCLLSD